MGAEVGGALPLLAETRAASHVRELDVSSLDPHDVPRTPRPRRAPLSNTPPHAPLSSHHRWPLAALRLLWPRPKAGLKRCPWTSRARRQKSTLGAASAASAACSATLRRRRCRRRARCRCRSTRSAALPPSRAFGRTRRPTTRAALQHWEVGWARRQAPAWKVRMRWEFRTTACSSRGGRHRRTDRALPARQRPRAREAYDAVGGGGDVDTEDITQPQFGGGRRSSRGEGR